MNIESIRADVVAGLTAGRPTPDLMIPLGLIDFWITTASAHVMAEDFRRKRTPMFYEPWMYTRFTCLVPSQPADDCDFDSFCSGSKNDKWVVNLPFTPMNTFGSMAIGSIHTHGGDVQFSLQRHVGPRPKHGRFMKATYSHPSASLDGIKLFLHAPKRNLEGCKIDVFAIPSEIPDTTGDECEPKSIEIPLAAELIYEVVARCVEKGIQYRSTNALDTKDEGKPKNITQEK